jgi:hypothetical protein
VVAGTILGLAELMMADNEGNASTPIAGSSVAISEVVGVFADAPVILGENPADYTQLTSKVLAAVRPGDFIEEMLVRDVIDLFWEVTRLRRLKTGLLNANMGKGIEEILNSVRYVDREDNDWLARDWRAGDKKARDSVAELLAAAGLSMEAVMGQTLSLSIDSIDRMDRMIASAEARRGNALREIERHRATLGAAVRAIAETEDAEFSEVGSEQ